MPSDSKLNVWLDFIKFLLGSFLIAMAPILINGQIQNRQVTIEEKKHEHELVLSEKERIQALALANLEKTQELDIERETNEQELKLAVLEQDQSFLGEYVDLALDENLERRLRFAHYFATLSVSDESRDLWQGYYDDLVVRADEQQKQLDEKIAQLENEIAKGSEGDQALIDQLTKEIAFLVMNLSPQPASSTAGISPPTVAVSATIVYTPTTPISMPVVFDPLNPLPSLNPVWSLPEVLFDPAPIFPCGVSC